MKRYGFRMRRHHFHHRHRCRYFKTTTVTTKSRKMLATTSIPPHTISFISQRDAENNFFFFSWLLQNLQFSTWFVCFQWLIQVVFVCICACVKAVSVMFLTKANSVQNIFLNSMCRNTKREEKKKAFRIKMVY